MVGLIVFLVIGSLALTIGLCVYASKKSNGRSYYSSTHHSYATKPRPPRPKKYIVWFITKSQYTSIKNQLLKFLINKENIQQAIDDFIGVVDNEQENITYQIVDDNDTRSNYKYEKIGPIAKHILPENEIKFFFRDNGSRVAKRIVQYFNDEGIKIYRINKTECYILLEKTSIHVAYLDYITRFEETAELHETFGWKFKRVRRNNRCKKLDDLVFFGGFHLVRPRENIYCKHVCAYRNNWQYDNAYVEPIKKAYNRVYTELSVNGSIPVRFRGEKDLLNLLITTYPDVVFQYHPDWLKPQSLDFYIPSLNVGIEFQGEEHYRPTNDSAKALAIYNHQIERDERKATLCNKQGLKLIIWKYDVPINIENLNSFLK